MKNLDAKRCQKVLTEDSETILTLERILLESQYLE
jgi:hypothetical protein